MATLEEDDTLAQDVTFLARIRGGVTRYAAQTGSAIIQMEDITQNDKLRLILARQVLADRDVWAANFAGVLAADQSVTADSDDDNLIFYIGQYWDLLAGISPG